MVFRQTAQAFSGSSSLTKHQTLFFSSATHTPALQHLCSSLLDKSFRADTQGAVLDLLQYFRYCWVCSGLSRHAFRVPNSCMPPVSAVHQQIPMTCACHTHMRPSTGEDPRLSLHYGCLYTSGTSPNSCPLSSTVPLLQTSNVLILGGGGITCPGSLCHSNLPNYCRRAWASS